MPNGRCRLHGGKSPGAPKGNTNAFKHGRYSAEKIKKNVHLRFPNYSGTLSTGGGLVFLALFDGTVAAFDDTTLEELWKINVGSGFTAPPMTFEANGRQYVAIASGPSPVVVRLLREFNPPELRGMRQATVLYVFGLYVTDQRAGDGDALALAAGQLRAVLAHRRVVSQRKLRHELVRMGRARGGDDVGFGRVGPAERDVLADGAADCVAHAEGYGDDRRYVADVVTGRFAPHNPAEVVKEFAALCKDYRVTQIIGDNFAGEWVAGGFYDSGIDYRRSELVRSDLYLEGLPCFVRGQGSDSRSSGTGSRAARAGASDDEGWAGQC